MAQDAPAGTTLHVTRAKGGGGLVVLALVELVLGAVLAGSGVALAIGLGQTPALLLVIAGAGVALYGVWILSLWFRSATLDVGPGLVVRAGTGLAGRVRLEGPRLTQAVFLIAPGGRVLRYLAYDATGRRVLVLGTPYWREEDLRAIGDVVGIGPGVLPGVTDVRSADRWIRAVATGQAG